MAESNSVSLGPNDSLVGQLHIEGDLNVSGTVEGELRATGNVAVGEGGKVKAAIAGRGVTIGGEVEGPVTASEKLVISRSGSLTGDIRVARLEIRDGARFSGNVSMGKAAQAPAEAEQPSAAQVREALVAESAVIAEAPAADQSAGDKARARNKR